MIFYCKENIEESYKNRQSFLDISFEDFLGHLVTEDEALEM